MATYTIIDLTVPSDTTSLQYKEKQSHFYMQGFPVYLNIDAPKDKTVLSSNADKFSYVCNIDYSYIEAMTESGNTTYCYPNAFTSFGKNIALTKIASTAATAPNMYTTNLPNLSYDAAFRITVFVKDDLNGTVQYRNTVVLYAYAYTNINPEIISSSRDQDGLNFQYRFRMTGPRLKSGKLVQAYYYWFNHTINGNGWSTYYNDIFISTSPITAPSTSPSSTSSYQIRAIAGIPDADVETWYFSSFSNNTGGTLTYSPDSNTKGNPDYTKNITIDYDDNRAYLTVSVKGINSINQNTAISESSTYYIYIQVYNNSSTKNNREYLGVASTRIMPLMPVMQIKQDNIRTMTVKNTNAAPATLMVGNPNNKTNSIALYHNPRIGYYDSNEDRYFSLEISTAEAEAWYDLVGHA